MSTKLSQRSRGWLRHLWRKAMTKDDWSQNGEPLPWWDQSSVEPMLSFPRFDLSESSYALLFMANRTPAWREVYTQILDKLIERHTTHWAAVDWLRQIGPDPRRGNYPKHYRGLIPQHLWGKYDVPGWTANGIEPWGLQADPVGADGMLFFRGFLNLMMGIHRTVSGAATWDQPFQVSGLNDQFFEWTHRRITDRLEQQWQQRPEGPHCENTKVWPFCLSAAGLGMMMADNTLGSKSHWVYGQWVEDSFMKRFMEFSPNGDIKSAPLYYDPLEDHVHHQVPLANLGTALYMLPQNREVALRLYERAVASVSFNQSRAPIYSLRKEQVRNYTMALLMALEFGDETTARRMRRVLDQRSEPRWFGDDDDEFGYFFEYGEPWPRGQESALLMVADYISEGAWSNNFSSFDQHRFSAPTIEGVDFPKLGIDLAYNDPSDASLKIKIYAASSHASGERSEFRIVNLPAADKVHVLRDGRKYSAWRQLDDSSIVIRSKVARHSFSVYTNYRGSTASPSKQGALQPKRDAASRQNFRVEISDLVSVSQQLTSSTSLCPCCA
ncbi:MAG: hypothetical protein ACI8W7_002067 [Gammaproteobacteria bacterium]|jgi:hypothetical protein